MTPRGLRSLAIKVLLLGALAVGVRVIATGAWRPQNTTAVLGFLLGEVFLLPMGGLLLIAAVAWGRWISRADDRGARRPERTGCVVAASIALLAMAIIWLAGRAIIPSVSRHWEWGRYGWSPGVELRDLGQVTYVTDLRFPAGAELVDGEWRGGAQPYLIARIEMPRESVDAFFAQPSFAGMQISTRYPRWLTDDFGPMRQRGWDTESARHVISSPAAQKRPVPDICRVLADTDDPERAVVYIQWFSLVGGMPLP